MDARIAAFAALVALTATPAIGRAQASKTSEKKACIAAAERGQELKRDGKLRDASSQFLLCARKGCPAAIVEECTRWAAEAEGALASVKLEAFDRDGKPITDVSLTIDGVSLGDTLPRGAVMLDPGSHEIRLEHGASPPFTHFVALAAGERDVSVRATFESPAPVAPAPTRPSPAPASPARGGSLVPAFVSAGVGVAALGAATTFWLLGNGDLEDARARCGADCPPDAEADDARQKHLIGDVALGVGVVAIALSVYFVLTRDQAPKPVVRF